jgi:hypothetical protein
MQLKNDTENLVAGYRGSEPKSRSLLFIFAFVFVLTLGASAFSQTRPKLRVLVEPTEDRWITFMDGEKLRSGFETSFLVAEKLFQSDRYLLLTGQDGMSTNQVSLASDNEVQDILKELAERLPGIEFSHLAAQQSASVMSLAAARRGPQIIIRPRVETLLYASGARSNRLVYGFSPDRLNPFNQGRLGTKDNEFIYRPKSDQIQVSALGQSCSNLDFFAGQMETGGFGPAKSNFGFDADEGVTFSILGFGFGFRKKDFEVKSEIVFELEVPSVGLKKDYRFDLKGSGRDLSIGIQYSGIVLGVEMQRRRTLREALAQILPVIVENFEREIPSIAWQTEITSEFNEEWIVPGGLAEGLVPGMKLISPYSSVYTVTKSFEQASVISPDPTNIYRPIVGESLRFHEVGKDAWQEAPFAVQSDSQKSLGTLDLGQLTRVESVAPVANLCSGKKPGFIERWVMNISYIYGLIRYKTVLDQPFVATGPKVVSSTSRVALISSGVSPKEERLKSHLESSGFDFLSWDARPSDDLGMGTAAAVIMEKNISSPFAIVPFRVLGPRGDTQSSTLYQAFEHVSKRDDIEYVVVPFKPSIESEALKLGIELCVKAGKKVFVAEGLDVVGATQARASDQDIKVSGLGGKVRLSRVGLGVVNAFVKSFNETSHQKQIGTFTQRSLK